MRYKIDKKVEPQLMLLLAATAISIVIWALSWYLPLIGYVVYPLRLFATFIHEGGHALAAILTGNSVQSLTVSSDGSGEVYSLGEGLLSGLLISSAGYLSTTAYGAALLAWIRYGFSSRTALYISAGFVGISTVIFGFLAPIWNLFATVSAGTWAFTVLSGAFLTLGLLAIARFASLKWAGFAVAFIAVQCLLNAVFDLLNVFFISATSDAHTDAANMAAATGLPGILWVLIWMGISIFMISVGLRIYAVNKNRSSDSVFED